jgi:hypothetical protein
VGIEPTTEGLLGARRPCSEVHSVKRVLSRTFNNPWMSGVSSESENWRSKGVARSEEIVQ